jgi:hypothetical protein
VLLGAGAGGKPNGVSAGEEHGVGIICRIVAALNIQHGAGDARDSPAKGLKVIVYRLGGSTSWQGGATGNPPCGARAGSSLLGA